MKEHKVEVLRYWNSKSWEKVKDLSIMIKQSEWVMFNPNYLKGSDTSFGSRNMTWGETTGNKYFFFSKLSDFSSNSFYDYVWWWMFLLHNKAWLELSYFKNFFSSDLVIVVFLCCMVLFCAFKLTRYQFSCRELKMTVLRNISMLYEN